MWLHLLLQKLGHISAVPTIIWANNQSAIVLAKIPKFYKHRKHINTKFHWFQEVIEQGVLLLKFFLTCFMTVDGLTKPLFLKQF